jgi:hypothetical protein
MLALSTTVETLEGTITTINNLIDDSQNNIDNYVYTISLDGTIKPSKVLSGSKQQNKTIELTLNNQQKIICTPDQEFPTQSYGYKQAKDLTENDFIMSCFFNRDNTLIFEHKTKIFLPSDYLANEEYNLYKELYDDRDILEILPEETGNIIDHLMTIASITQDRDQLFNRLANDIFLKNMLSVDYLKKSEVITLINHFNIEYKHKEYSDDEKALSQLLNINTPDDLEGRLESLLSNLKELDLSLFEKCGIVIDGELTTDHLMNACLLLGYSNADHLTSVKHMHGFRVVKIDDGDDMDVGGLLLENGENVGLGCGVFAKVG